MPTPSLGGREPIGFSHKAREGHRESAFIPRDPGSSNSALNSDVGYLGRAGSFYTAWCQMHELFTPMTSEVSRVWDAGFEFLQPPPPPPPPPRHRRSSLWDVSEAVPQERPENGSELHWTNPYGPDPPAEVAPPAVEPVVEVAFLKATTESSSSCREEGCRPGSTIADHVSVSDPSFSSTPPVEEPAFAALANLRVCVEMPPSFTLSDYYSRQGPLSPCSPAPTESFGGREPRFSQATTVYPAPTESLLDGQAWSPASTQVGAPLPEHGGQGLAGGFSPKFPPGVPTKPDDLLRQYNDCPLGMPPPDDDAAHRNWPHFSQDRNDISEHCFEQCSDQWCGLFSSCCHASAPETCSRCERVLGSFLDHYCSKCPRAVCVNCLEKMSGQTFSCSCGDEVKIESTLWMIGAYNSVMNAFAFLTGAKPAGASQGYTAMPSRSHAYSVLNPLLEPPSTTNTAALPQHRTLCPATTKELLPPTAPLPAPPSLPSLLGHRRRASQVADVFKTHLPGEMPCSPLAR